MSLTVVFTQREKTRLRHDKKLTRHNATTKHVHGTVPRQEYGMNIMRKITIRIALLLALTVASPAAAQNGEMEQNMFEAMRESDKAAVVAVHAGAGDHAAQLRIGRFNEELRQAFPECEFREARTSRTQADEANMSTPDELFVQLKKEGFTHVLVQPSCIANSTDMQYLRSAVETAKDMFKQIRLGEPLLCSPADYEKVIDITAKACGAQKAANVLVCNGSTYEEDAQFAMLDYMLRDKGLANWHVGSTSGYPSIDSLIRQLKAGKTKKVHLIPLAFDESEQDIAATTSLWATALQKAGYKVTADTNCVGDINGIISLFKEHCKHAEEFRSLTAKERQFIKK